MQKLSPREIKKFQGKVWKHYKTHQRSFPWRDTEDPYKIVVSEIMLQQTQSLRVVEKYKSFIKAFPSWRKLSTATLSEVLSEWQGLGYNRRAKNLQGLAQKVVHEFKGKLPTSYDTLIDLPGIGPATATAIRAFAFNLPGLYLETNVRSLYLHYFFPNQTNISDKIILPLIEITQDSKRPREWNWALLDLGADLKKKHGNPSRASSHYTKQDTFKGSNRELRGKVLRLLLRSRTILLSSIIVKLGEPGERVKQILQELITDGLVKRNKNKYSIV